ncbi:DNA polymerase II [Nitrincola alkalisediminis]
MLLEYWLQTPEGAQVVRVTGEHAVCFVLQSQQAKVQQILASLTGWYARHLPLKDLLQRPVSALYFSHLKTYREALERLQAQGITLMEEDIRPVDRYLMERFIFSGAQVCNTPKGMHLKACDYQPQFRILSLDIETTLTANRILSVALQGLDFEKVLMVGQTQTDSSIIYCRDEKQLLLSFMQHIHLYDPDIIIGWNIIGFDLSVLDARARALGVSLQIGRDQQALRIERRQQGNRHYVRLNGRVVLDGIDTLKGATWHFERYSLEYVAQALLGRGKDIESVNDRGQAIQRLYAEDQEALARYNLEDCRLVTEIFEKTGLIEYLTERTRLTGLSLDKVGGSAQAFDNLYLPSLHRAGFVAPEYASGQRGAKVPGGFVMDSKPGLYRHVLVLDFKSLYPSIIRTFKIDPLGLTMGVADSNEHNTDDTVPGFLGAVFSKEHSILPGIIERLWQARDAAKQQGNAAMSQAIKIQMNACYGVLGSDVCRFYDQRLSGSITLRGHQILTETASYIEKSFGYEVIYGDTDSVFVWLGDDVIPQECDEKGAELARCLNDWWRQRLQQAFGLTSALELQYETHFERFLMPRMRHSEEGSKKRYAGLKRQGDGTAELVFKGLEQVRSDWTPLARVFQHELFQRVFEGLPCQAFVRERVAALLNGELDNDLVYRRRLRRPLSHYQRNIPPHVKAARQLNQYYREKGWPEPLRQGDTVAYVVTLIGPEAAEIFEGRLDYQHYIEKQLRPVADSILPFVGESFDDVTQPQIALF